MNQTISIQTKYFRYRDDLFFLAYLLLFFNAILPTYINFDESIGDEVRYIVRILYLLFLGVCVLSLFMRASYSTMELLSIGGLLILGIVSYFLADSHIFFDLTLMISISKNIDFEKFLKRAMLLLIVFLFITICLSGLEIIQAVVKPRTDNGQARNSLGFSHPNTLGLLVFELIAGIIALERKRLKTIHLWLLLGLGVIVYWITKSQSCLVGVCLLIFAVLIYKFLARKVLTPVQMKKLFAIILIIIAIVLFFVIRYYWADPSALPFSTLASRFRYAQKYIDAYGVNFFGQEIEIGENVALPGYAAGYAALDNGEIWYLIRFGVVGCGIFFYTYVRMVIKSINKKEFVFCIIAVVYLIYSITENSALRIPFNFIILYGGIVIYSGNLLKIEKFKGQAHKNNWCFSLNDGVSGTSHE